MPWETAVPRPPRQGAAVSDDDERWIDRAIALAVVSVGDGGGPFGAVVVAGDTVLGEGVNRVTRDLDPTAHAEVVAIRASCRAVADFQLGGATLYASCEPCPLCVAASLWARLDRVVFAADRHDAARAGFDDEAFHELMSRDETGELQIAQLLRPGSQAPFEAWLANEARTEY